MVPTFAIAAILNMGSAATPQESFSCSWGKNAACLDYGDVVCRSSAKCVSQDAVCFDSFTCDYKGFACKSKLDEIVDEVDDKVRRYNELADQFNGLNSSFDSLKVEYDSATSRGAGLARCVDRATSLDEAKSCRL